LPWGVDGNLPPMLDDPSTADADTVTSPATARAGGRAGDATARATDRDARPADDPRKHIRMSADRVLARVTHEGERRSRTGILIPATADVSRRLMWAEVVLVGPTVRNIEEGDRVLFSPEHSFEVDLRGDDYLLLRERDIHAVASDRNEGRTGLYL
jgi:chaperonin GroES